MGWVYITAQASKGRKVSRQDVTDVLKRKAEENKDKEQVLITANRVKSEIEVEEDIELSYQAVRDRGVQQGGYYMTKWPDVFDYNKKGDPQNWGLLMKPAEFLDKLEERDG